MAGPYPNDQGNPAGAIPVYLTAPPAGSVHSAHISTNTTTLVKSGAGTLNSIMINTAGSSDYSVTVYDSLTGSGTVLGVLTNPQPGQRLFGIPFSTGLTIVTAGTTPGDLTISYS